ncbi:hypothetical protein [Stigmatella aurantiaca]|uniref:hypothetical protein n=1 Tax=Stigmatella aurantiaca TaxID=41 RepID=UPI000564CC0A|nr:hypothetical protein [Stigmatella aurantiaca]
MSRVWFFGHARYDLWLALDHDFSGHEAISPAADAVVSQDGIKKLSAFSFVPQKTALCSHKFFGCNTKPFAEKWASAFSVYAEGSSDKVGFEKIHETSGKVVLSAGAQWYQCYKAGAPRLLWAKTGDQVS